MYLNDFRQGCQDYSMEKGHFYFQQMVLGKMITPMQKNENELDT